jgi:hypothetical protein
MSEIRSPEYLIQEPQDVFAALNMFWTFNPVTLQGESKIINLLPFIDQARQILLVNSQMQVQWGIFYANIGKTAMNHLGHFDQDEFADFLLSKHRKYGMGPLLKWAHTSIIMRIDSKLERFVHIQTNPVVPGEKDDEDQIMDILGYCVLGFHLDLYFKAILQQIRNKIIVVKNMPLIGKDDVK